jgi:alpha-galactosidase
VWQPSQCFGRWFGGYESSPGGLLGRYWFGRVDTAAFASWGFDYVKWDWLLSANASLTRLLTRELGQAIASSGRDTVLSLSNDVGSVGLMAALPALGADVVRIGPDIHDNWGSVSGAAAAALQVLTVVGEGFWPDPDMLQIGWIGTPNGLNTHFHKTQLTDDEQYFQVSFWAVLPAPLLLSGDLNALDAFTLGLVRNREVIAVNQDGLARAAKKIDGNEVLAKELSDGSVAVGLFNWGTAGAVLRVEFTAITAQMGIDFSGGANVRSLWEQEDVGLFKSEFQMYVNPHGAALLKLIPVKADGEGLVWQNF